MVQTFLLQNAKQIDDMVDPKPERKSCCFLIHHSLLVVFGESSIDESLGRPTDMVSADRTAIVIKH